MKIIRDEELFGLAMIPLFYDWNVRRCNVEGCRRRPTTIVVRPTPDISMIGLCEEHYQEAAKEGGTTFTLEFDDYDAFASQEEKDGSDDS